MLTLFFKGLIIGFAIAAPVGPIGVLCIQRSLHDGFKIGLMTGLGAALADGCYGLIAGFGLTALSSFLVAEQFWIRVIGGLFLLYLGAKLLLTPAREQSTQASYDKSGWHACATTFLLTLANPATILSFVAVFAGLGLGSMNTDYFHATNLVLGITLGSAIWWLFLSGVVALVLHHRMSSKNMRYINIFSGIIIFAFGVFALMFLLGATTKNNMQQSLQKALDNYRHKINAPGIAMSITSRDAAHPFHYLLFSGVTTLQGFTPVKEDNLFQVGSITKSFVAAAILQAEANQKYHFNINQTVGQWLPQYPEWKEITIRQLLNHTSGIYNYVDLILKDGINQYPDKHWTPNKLVAIATTHAPYFKPGKGWHYSNTNYILVGILIKAVTGEDLDKKVQELIKQAKLPNTYYLPQEYPANLMPRMAHGYNGNHQDVTTYNLSWASAAGALVSTAQDLDNWIVVLLTPGTILPPQQLTEMQTLVCVEKNIANGCLSKGIVTHSKKSLMYGFGIMRYNNNWWHTGGLDGYTALTFYSPEKKISVGITTNFPPKLVPDEFNYLLEHVGDILYQNKDQLRLQPKKITNKGVR